MTKTFFIITFVLTLSNVFGQTNPKVTSEFVNLLISSKDTLTIYERHSNCDSVTLYKFQIYKGTSNYIIKTFRHLTFKLPKKCYDLVKHNPDKLNFKLFQTCGHSAESLDFLKEYESAIRNINKDNPSCDDKIKFTISIGSKSYSNKNRCCGQDISLKIHNYFGCAVADPDNKSME